MASTISSRRHSQIVPNEFDTPSSTQIFRPNETDTTPYSTPRFRPSSRRTSSFGSSPSFSSNSPPRSLSFGDPGCESPSSSPSPPPKFSGRIPFSWEQIPGLPKNQIENKKDSPLGLDLPLPPAGSSSGSLRKGSKGDISPKKFTNESFREDPFLAALVECSKDDHDGLGKFLKDSKMSKRLSHRLAIISMYTSCKSACGVSESIVCLPRSRSYSPVNRRSI